MRRRLLVIRIHGLGIAALLVALAGCDRQDPAASTQPLRQAASARPTLAASVFPIADLVQRVARDRWQVVTLLPPGRNPHGYSLRPAEAQSLATARVLFAAGQGLDGWAIRAAHGINPQCQVIVLTDALGLNESAATQPDTDSADHHEDDADASDPHAHSGMDPHLWLDPLLAGRIAELAARELTRLDPASRDFYEKNLADLKQQLTLLDDDYRTTLASCRVHQLVVFHPGYGYLARRYGLEQVSIVPGVGAAPSQVEQAIDRIKRDRIPAVYREPQFDSRWVEFVSRHSGAKVLVLDPQGHAAKPGYDSYFAMMRTNLAQLKEGLDCGH